MLRQNANYLARPYHWCAASTLRLLGPYSTCEVEFLEFSDEDKIPFSKIAAHRSGETWIRTAALNWTCVDVTDETLRD